MSRIDDPKNILGMSEILAGDDEDVDLQQLEQAIMHGTKMPDKDPTNIEKDFQAELEKIGRSLQTATQPFQQRQTIQPSEPDRVRDDEQDDDQSSDTDDDQDEDADDDQPVWKDTQLRQITEEEKRQRHIKRALGDIDSNKDSRNLLDQEDEEDELARIMEQADMLREYIHSQNPKLVERVPRILPSTPVREARIIFKTLQRKNDSLRSVDMFEEGMLSLAYGIEQIFDGKREVFGFKIDLTGWSDTLKVKLKRMRYHTGAFIKEMMHDYDINHGWYIVLEILPSMLLYTKDRRTQNKDTLMNDERYRSVLGEIRN
jgi:hypothetical protein